jgi:photosystem II stability/assembly factor-like uncharacterized protein
MIVKLTNRCYKLGSPKPLIGNLVRHILIILSLFLFSLTIISCTSSSTTNSDNETTTDNETRVDLETTTDNTTNSSGLFVAVGWRLYKTDPYCFLNACLEYESRILTSSDNGVTWDTIFGNLGLLTSIDLIDKKLMVSTSGYNSIYSEDGLSWYYERNFPRDSEKFAYGNGTFLAFNPSWWTFAISFDGMTWNVNPIGVISDGFFGNNIFIIGGNSGIFKSKDYGVSWTKTDPGTWLYDIAFGNNTFVGTISGGVIKSIDNGTTWTYNSNLVSGSLNGIIYGNSKFVAVGSEGKIFTLSNGDMTWVERTSGTTHDLNHISYGNGTFVVVGDNDYPPSSVILISDDSGVTWKTKFTSGTKWQTSDGNTNRLSGVAFIK